jgi:hypothetical protein
VKKSEIATPIAKRESGWNRQTGEVEANREG